MYYELYIDVFFLENFMLDSLLLLIVNRITNNGRSYGRILLGGGLGSLLTCLVIALPFPSVLRLILFHTAVNSAMLFAGLRITGLPQFIRMLLILYASAFILGGIMQAFRPYMRYISVFYAAAALYGTGKGIPADSLPLCRRGIIYEGIPPEKDMYSHGRRQMDRQSSGGNRGSISVR